MVGNSSVAGVQQGQCEMSQLTGSQKEQEPVLELQSCCATTRSTGLSPQLATSMPHSAPKAPEPFPLAHKDAPRVVLNKQISDHSTHLPSSVNSSPVIDCYSWRKYGKKQVKSSNTSRSYYRCSHPNCSAKKKVQQCDGSGYVTNIVYIGTHNHDPPPSKGNRSRGFVSSTKPAVCSYIPDPLVQNVDHKTSSCLSDVRQSSQQRSETEQQSSGSYEGNVGINVKYQNTDRPDSKVLFRGENSSYESAASEVLEEDIDEHRLEGGSKERGSLRSDPVLEAINEPKDVIYTASEGRSSCDGYRWRKYGQKIVKGNSQFRSYYRCTSSGCPARKQVERSTVSSTTTLVTYGGEHDHDMPELVVTNIVYIGTHKHDPPPSKGNRSRGFVSSTKPAVCSHTADVLVQNVDHKTSSCLSDGRQSSQQRSETEQQSSGSYEGNVGINMKYQNTDRPDSKVLGPQENSSFENAASEVLEEDIDEHRLEGGSKERGGLRSDPVLEAINEPKVVVYAAPEGRSSCDGYRWRKYGQKIVKGNSQFRSYYRCTSSGCPARKQVERSTASSTTTLVTYGGEHDHDMPELVVKRRHGPESPLGITPVDAGNNCGYHKRPKNISCQSSLTRPAEEEMDLMCEKILELGGRKALESAQTLLSIGSQLRPALVGNEVM
ncbi:hypothetical protein Tsubulata_019439 [Turnera subulata]|uniref:WRKY domain-containing protein n=1 Tax=Turnera subulata TaxID=218843 RepID=A0A9Q0J3P0_9ROSI|nr:hypothetical protein Tsubulata_019439 [Turnera subulata]